jgi:hypothetical protein
VTKQRGPWPTFANGISSGLDELEKRLNDAFDGDLTTSNMATVRQGAGEAIGLLMRGAFVVVSVAFSAVSTLLRRSMCVI